MTAAQILSLSGVVISLVIGQVLFKLASSKIIFDRGLVEFFRTAMCWEFVSAMILYAGSTVLWVAVLRTMALSKAYPFNALAFVLVPIASYFLFGDPISRQYVIGTMIFLVGLFLVASS